MERGTVINLLNILGVDYSRLEHSSKAYSRVGQVRDVVDGVCNLHASGRMTADAEICSR